MSPETLPIRRALLSVHNKSGLVELAAGLAAAGVELVSTGGTYRLLVDSGLQATPVEQVTGFREMLDGRVKTLHPAIHGGLLADRARAEHLAEIESAGIRPIDMAVVNLYPFTEVALTGTHEEAIENIDIGGPAMLRSAAKNYRSVAVVTAPEQYEPLLAELNASGGLSAATRLRLAREAFARTAEVDAAIAAYLWDADPDRDPLPAALPIAFRRSQLLRYGENPHQRGALYRDPMSREPGAANARQVHGSELSYVNLLDLDAALNLVKGFDQPACSIIKHTNPCGCAVGDGLADAYRGARDGELPPFNPPGSRFGGIIGFNRTVDRETANEIVAPQSFYHAVIAPGFTPEAVAVFAGRSGWGASIRLLETGPLPPPAALAEAARGLERLDFKRITGGLLVQERDVTPDSAAGWRVVTERPPGEREQTDLDFAWRVVRHVKSNAIVLASGGRMVGMGCGQVNRALPCRLAVEMAGARARGAVCASDAFFPFSDGPEALAAAGVTAIIQPGGAKQDQASIDLCNRHGLAMVFTDVRHFAH